MGYVYTKEGNLNGSTIKRLENKGYTLEEIKDAKRLVGEQLETKRTNYSYEFIIRWKKEWEITRKEILKLLVKKNSRNLQKWRKNKTIQKMVSSGVRF